MNKRPIIVGLVIATVAAACDQAPNLNKKKWETARDLATAIENTPTSPTPIQSPEGWDGEPPLLDMGNMLAIWLATQQGSSQSFRYDSGKWIVTVIFINDPKSWSLWESWPFLISMNVTQLTAAYERTTNILLEAWLQNRIIPLTLFTQAIINQELYHATSKDGGNELDSEYPSLTTPHAWEFYFLFRLSGTIFGGLWDPIGFESRLNSWGVLEPEQYKRVFLAYKTAILATDPNFLEKCPVKGDPVTDETIFSTYLQGNPEFLQNGKNNMLKNRH